MREIEFRGKREDNGEWVYGSLIITDRSYFIFTCDDDCDIGESYMEDAGGILILPETIGQYTGLKDKNGTKIFEGDIVKTNILYDVGCYPHEETKIVEVKYIKGYFYPFYGYVRGKIEVIGNIHDNPELLEV